MAAPRVHLGDARPHLRQGLGRGGVDLVDDDDVRAAQVGLAGVVAQLVARAQRVRHDDRQVGLVERQVVVAAVPEDHVGLGLGGPQDVLVVHAREDEAPGIEMRLVLLALLDRRLVAVQVRVGLVALAALRDQVAVRHRVADHRDLEALRLEQRRHVAAGLALAAAGADRADRDDRARALEQRGVGAQQLEVGAGRQGAAGRVHDLLVAHVAVGEHDRVDGEVPDQGLELALGPDRDALGVALAGERGRVAAVRDAGDLRRGEGDHLDARGRSCRRR